MFKREKIEVIPWNDFFAKHRAKEVETAILAAGGVTAVFIPTTALASDGISEKVTKAFDPIIDLLQGISFPICFLMVSGGFIMFMLGKKSKGLDMIKWAALGYIGLQFAPAIMQILVTVGKAMRESH